MVKLWTTPGTDITVAYDIVGFGSYIEPQDGTSQRVVHTGLVVVSTIGGFRDFISARPQSNRASLI